MPRDIQNTPEPGYSQRRKDARNAKKARGRAGIILLAVLVLLAAATVTGLWLIKYQTEKKLNDRIAAGNEYLSAEDYKNAIAAFREALEIDPQNADAYWGIVEADIGGNEFEQAYSDAKEGYEKSRDERLNERIAILESGEIFALKGWKMRMTGYDGDGNVVFWHQYGYNLKKQLSSVTKYNAEGEAEQRIELTYDETGRELVSYTHAEKSGDLYRWVYEYNGDNIRITKYDRLSDEIMGYRDEEKDSEGRLVKIVNSDNSGEISSVGVFEYSKDKLTRYSVYDKDENLMYYQIYQYNGSRESGFLRYGSDDELRSCLKNQYDADGNYTGCCSYTADGLIQYEYRE